MTAGKWSSQFYLWAFNWTSRSIVTVFPQDPRCPFQRLLEDTACCRPDSPLVKETSHHSIGHREKKHENMRQQNRWENNIFTNGSRFLWCRFFFTRLGSSPSKLGRPLGAMAVIRWKLDRGSCLTPPTSPSKGIYPIHTQYVRCIWGWL